MLRPLREPHLGLAVEGAGDRVAGHLLDERGAEGGAVGARDGAAGAEHAARGGSSGEGSSPWSTGRFLARSALGSGRGIEAIRARV